MGNNEDIECLLRDCQQDEIKATGRPHMRSPNFYIRWCFTWALLVISLLINTAQLLKSQIENLDEVCLQHTTQYPNSALAQSNFRFKSVEFNGSFYKSSSIYVQPPSGAVDQAWHAIGAKSRHMIVPRTQYAGYGLKRGHGKLIDEQGGGYPAKFEFEHNLHCLDVLRKNLHYNYDYYVARELDVDGRPHIANKKHADHCVDALRQVLMCKPEMGVYGQYWALDLDRPFVDFSHTHKCVDYEAVLRRANELAVNPEADKKLRIELRDGDITLVIAL